MTQVPDFQTLAALLGHAMTRFADRPAYGTKRGSQWEWITYSQLGALVARCRGGLAALGVGRGDRVAIIADNRIEWIVAAHATYQRRAIFVPMAEAQSEAEWKAILGDSGARLCFVANPSIASRVNTLREDLLDLQHIVALDAPEHEPASFARLLALSDQRDIPARDSAPSDVATLIYTSGTTGEPKGVRLTHRNLAVGVGARIEVRDYGDDALSMSFLPWMHVFGGQVELNAMMAVGGAVAICPGVDDLFAEIQNIRPTVLYAVPRIWRQIYHDMRRALAAEPEMSRNMFDTGIQLMQRQRRGETLKFTDRMYLNMARKLVIAKLKARLGGKLRVAISGAAPLSIDVADFMQNLGITIYEGYGLTESSGSSTTNPTDAPRFGSVGKPIRGARIEIDDSAADEQGGAGEIIIYGSGVMEGYHNRPSATREALTPEGGLRTGDLGHLDADGYLHITGRIKEIYKLSSGRYVAPAPLEDKLKLSPFISHCMLYGPGQAFNVALIVADIPALRAFLAMEDATDDELIATPQARRLYEDEILKYSRDFRTFELVRNFWLVSEPFTRANGMMTPALKLLRRKVLERYEARLKSLY